MSELKRESIYGRGVVIDGDDIDTDRIVPARFLKEITFDAMGEYLFCDVRFDESGNALDFPLNDARFDDAAVMIVGQNFGCGSSREHAPQAILRYGIQAIIGESFAEIFLGNCQSLGIPCVTVSAPDRARLAEAVLTNPQSKLRVDIASRHVAIQEETIAFSLADDRQQAFLAGTWDATALLKANADQIAKTAARLPYVTNFQ